MAPQVTIMSTGEELVRGRTADTNAAFAAARLDCHGFEVRRLLVVGDDPGVLQQELEGCLGDSDLVLLSGGLGPTADDRTRAAIARALCLELVEDEDTRVFVSDRISSYGHSVTGAQLSQARFPAGAVIFPNPRGTARGFACQANGAWVVAMPGVPHEMRAMLTESVLPFLMRKLMPGRRVALETVHLFPVPEPEVDERLADVMTAGRNPSVGITVRDGIITVSLRAGAEGEQEARELVRRDVEMVEDRFGDLVFGRGRTSLAGAVSDQLERAGRTIAVAESITGGLIGHMLVDIPGISRFFLADVVAYSNEAKVRQLGVPRDHIVQHGAVSSRVAEDMAVGICRATGADLGLSTTGIAGPTGGTEEKPVGLVYVGLCLDGQTAVRKLNLRGDRWRIKDRAAKYALNLTRLALKNGLKSVRA